MARYSSKEAWDNCHGYVFSGFQFGVRPQKLPVDAFSRFCHIYALSNRTAILINAKVKLFVKDFEQYYPIRMWLTDNGGEMAQLSKVKGVPHHTSAPGQPVTAVENHQSMIMRKVQIYRTAGLITDPAVVLRQIQDQLNNTPRLSKKNYTPIEILKLEKSKLQGLVSNRFIPVSGYKKMKNIFIGDSVRILTWDRKTQVASSFVKGYAEKWSRDVYEVKQIKKLANNDNLFRYKLNNKKTYFRHEILKIRKDILYYS